MNRSSISRRRNMRWCIAVVILFAALLLVSCQSDDTDDFKVAEFDLLVLSVDGASSGELTVLTSLGRASFELEGWLDAAMAGDGSSLILLENRELDANDAWLSVLDPSDPDSAQRISLDAPRTPTNVFAHLAIASDSGLMYLQIGGRPLSEPETVLAFDPREQKILRELVVSGCGPAFLLDSPADLWPYVVCPSLGKVVVDGSRTFNLPGHHDGMIATYGLVEDVLYAIFDDGAMHSLEPGRAVEFQLGAELALPDGWVVSGKRLPTVGSLSEQGLMMIAVGSGELASRGISEELWFVDPADGTVADRLVTEGSFRNVTITPNDEYVVLADSVRGEVSVTSVETGENVLTSSVGRRPVLAFARPAMEVVD